jgi:hypothetical protein
MQTCPNCRANLPNPVACLTCYSLFVPDLRTRKAHLISILNDNALVRAYSDEDEGSADETRQLFWRTIEKEYPKITSDESGWLFLELFDELIGYGAIGPIMRDPSMREVRVLAHDQIFAHNMIGQIKTGLSYESPEHLKNSMQTVIDKLSLASMKYAPEKYEYHAPNMYHLTINLAPSGSDPEYLKVKSVLA